MSNTLKPRAMARALVMLAGVAGLSAVSAQSIDVTGKQRETSELKTVQVRYGDLDLRQTDDRAQMDRRVRFAARTVCGPTSIKSLDARTKHMNCSIAAIDGANAQLARVTQTMTAGGGD